MVQRRAGRGLKSAEMALEPDARIPKKARRALELVGKALEQAGRAVGPAGRTLEPSGRPRASWEGRLGGPERGRIKRKLSGMWWYHRSSTPMGPLPNTVPHA